MSLEDTNKRIVIVNQDGSITILCPAPEYLKDHTLAELIAKDVPQSLVYHIVDASEIPTDRTFRGAWTWQ